MSVRGDERYINKYPDDAAEVARVVQSADLATATVLLQLWGSKQRDIGGLKAIEVFKESINA